MSILKTFTGGAVAACLLISAAGSAEAALLTMSIEAAPSSFNLTTLGTTDWAYYRTGSSTFEKAGGTAIGAATFAGAANANLDAALVTMSWTDAAAAPLSGSDSDYRYSVNPATNTSGLVTLNIAATTVTQRLYVIYGGRINPGFTSEPNKNFTLTATLNDGSGLVDSELFSSTLMSATTNANNFRMVTIDFATDSASTLTLNVTAGGTTIPSWITIQAVALGAVPEPSSALLLGGGMLGCAFLRRRREPARA